MADVLARVLFTILFIYLLCTQQRRELDISSSNISYNGNSKVFETTSSHTQHLRLALPHFSPPRGITRGFIVKRKFYSRRISYYSNSSSSFNPVMLLLCGVCPNPGPVPTKDKKVCLACSKTIKANVKPLNCNECRGSAHWKCAGLKSKSLTVPRWTCWTCLQPFNFSDSFFEDPTEFLPPTPSESDVKASELNVLKRHANNLKLGHLNVNSISGFKFFDVKNMLTNNLFDILVLSETKIDNSYPDSQFYVKGFKLYRQDRTNSGGGLII